MLSPIEAREDPHAGHVSDCNLCTPVVVQVLDSGKRPAELVAYGLSVVTPDLRAIRS